MINKELRRLAEFAILENLTNEEECKKIITQAFNAGLFTKEEVNKIVADVKTYNDIGYTPTNPEQNERDRISRELFNALGPSVSFTLSKLIHQYPNRIYEGEWFIPDLKDIEKSININPAQVEAIILILKDKKLIDTKVDKEIKKRLVKINFHNVAAIYTDTNNSDKA